MSGSSFNGLLEEVPGIGVDRFNNGASTFLLTHCHTDHLIGLDNINFSGTIYCSQTTRDLLRLNRKYRHNLNYVRPLDLNQNYELYVHGQVVTITLIPANHCPGAVMFLVETDTGKSVLCTGDLRAEGWWLESLMNSNPYLLPYSSKLRQRQLDTIYLDTTFGYRGEPFIEMLNNNDGINIAILLLKSYPMDDPEIYFCFKDFILGFELAWLNICKSFNCKLHLSETLGKRLKVLGGAYEEIMGTANESCLFHACEANSNCSQDSTLKFKVLIRQCINFNAIDFTGVFCPFHLNDIAQEELKLISETQKGNKIFEFRGRNWILPKGRSELLSSEIKLIFSRHSSYLECCNVVKSFQPRQVYPCVDSKESWKLGALMSRLFGKFCNTLQPPSPKDFRYDTVKLTEWGLPCTEVRERLVKVINRWNLLECQREMEIAVDYVKRKGRGFDLNIRGQHWTSEFRDPNYSEDDRNCDIARRKDYNLQNLVIGRGERAYRAIIQDLQKLYRNLDVDKGKGYEFDKDFNEDALHDQENELCALKLGGLDGYNYDKSSNSLEESFGVIPSSEIEKVRTDAETDIDDSDEDIEEVKQEYEREHTLGVPSQLVEVGDCLVLRRISSSVHHEEQKNSDSHLVEFSFQVLISDEHALKDSFYISTGSRLRSSKTSIEEQEWQNDEAVQSVAVTLQANPMSWLGIGLKSTRAERTEELVRTVQRETG